MGLQSLRLFQMSMVWTKLPDYSCVKDGYFDALTNVITWTHKFIYLYAIAHTFGEILAITINTHLRNDTATLNRSEIYLSLTNLFIE